MDTKRVNEITFAEGKGLGPEELQVCGEGEEDALENETEQRAEKQKEIQQSVWLLDSEELLEQMENVRPHEFGKN